MLLLPLLRTALENGATSVEVSRMPLGLRFYRGKELLAREPLSIEDFTAIGEALRRAGARGDRSTELELDTPRGPMQLAAKFSPIGVQLTLPVTDEESDAAVALSELIGKLLDTGSTQVICTASEAEFKQGALTAETVPLVPGALATLRDHAHKLAGGAEGSFVVFSGGARTAVTATIADDRVTFSLN